MGPASAARIPLGLVVGKFAPLHRGHEWLIDQAAEACERLLILSYTKPEFERCEVAQRRRWLQQRFPQHERVVVDDAWLLDACARRGIAARTIPLNDEADAVQQNFLAWLLHEVLNRRPQAIFCSEHYGPPTATVLSQAFGHAVHAVHAVVVDLERARVPISASRIRRDPRAHREWLSPEVRAAFTPRIVLLGGESSGKTTLTKALAERLQTTWVAEYGRELWERRNGELSEADLLHIGREQIRREEAALHTAHRILLCDTSPLTTYGYALWTHDRADPALAALATRRYDGAILCSPDFPFVQDGTRRDEAFRSTQHAWYRDRLSEIGGPVLEVGGTLEQRTVAVLSWLARWTDTEPA